MVLGHALSGSMPSVQYSSTVSCFLSLSSVVPTMHARGKIYRRYFTMSFKYPLLYVFQIQTLYRQCCPLSQEMQHHLAFRTVTNACRKLFSLVPFSRKRLDREHHQGLALRTRVLPRSGISARSLNHFVVKIVSLLFVTGIHSLYCAIPILLS